jgi:hypothetical protein
MPTLSAHRSGECGRLPTVARRKSGNQNMTGAKNQSAEEAPAEPGVLYFP